MSRAIAGRSRGAAGDGASTSRTRPRWVKSVEAYFTRSELPLTGLVFLLPMIVLYEVGTRYYASDWARQTETRVLAFNLMRQFLELFGASGKYLPGGAVVGILLTWHLARRDKWQLHIGTAGVMGFESILLAIPLLALAGLIGQYVPLYNAESHVVGGVVLSLGAGIYEELVFRLIGLTLLNILLIDLLRVARRPALVLMVVSSAVAFAAYHYWGPQAGPIKVSDFVFRALSGVYFGVLFMARGFGITAGTHATYDIFYFVLRAMAVPS